MVSELEIKNAQLAVELRWARETTLRLSAATTALMQATYRLAETERACERKAGALWALGEIASTAGHSDLKIVHVEVVREMISDLKRGAYADAIERGDMEVPNA